jgi:hypothetical protein
VLADAGLTSIPSGLWATSAAFLALESAVLGGLIKLVLQFRADNKELQDKIMDRAIPALEANADATKMMVGATQQALTALAVAQAVKDSDDRQPPPRRRT